jgi:hypothetical protein
MILMGQIHFEGDWKGLALKIETFWALKWQRAKRVPFRPSGGGTERGGEEGSPSPPSPSLFVQNNLEINSDMKSA